MEIQNKNLLYFFKKAFKFEHLYYRKGLLLPAISLDSKRLLFLYSLLVFRIGSFENCSLDKNIFCCL